MNIKTIAFALLATAATTGIQAQAPAKPTQDAQMQAQREQERIARTNESSALMAKELGLDAKQTAALKELDERYARMLNEVRASTTDRAVIMEKDASMRAQYDADLKDMLTPEQYQQVLAKRKANGVAVEPVAPASR